MGGQRQVFIASLFVTKKFQGEGQRGEQVRALLVGLELAVGPVLLRVLFLQQGHSAEEEYDGGYEGGGGGRQQGLHRGEGRQRQRIQGPPRQQLPEI